MLNKLDKLKSGRLYFILIGITTTIWFLIRVIPKPSRASYPCMKASAPIMSAFVIYLLSFTGAFLAFKKTKENILNSKFRMAGLFALFAVLSGAVFFSNNIENLFASTDKLAAIEAPNTPMGESKGIFPGRVVWVFDKNATNENCSNTSGDAWFQDKNTNQLVVSTMLANGIKKATDKTSTLEAWDALFKYFNNTRGNGKVGYKSGEKICIKINLTNSSQTGYGCYNDRMDATPQLVLALLEELIDSVGVTQSDITIGDPYRNFEDIQWNKCHSKYPDVHYIDGYGEGGREQTIESPSKVLFFSDPNPWTGKLQQLTSTLPQAYIDAKYFINMPCMKSHGSAGISLAAKNHQGSVMSDDGSPSSQSAGFMHYCFPAPGDNDGNAVGMGHYRHLVDYMGSKYLGGNTLIYIVDGIWSGRDWQGYIDKWQMAPFNNDFTSSLFISQDPVAIESVGFDFLYNEYKNYSANHKNLKYPLLDGAQDYIHQAADTANWSKGIKYAPNGDGIALGSLGAHEHWNNSTDKQYSVNLTGVKGGIQLVSVPENLVATLPYTPDPTSINLNGNNASAFKIKAYPNPASSNVNIEYELSASSHVKIEIQNTEGKKLCTIINTNQNAGKQTINWLIKPNVGNGIYILTIIKSTKNNAETSSIKLLIQN